MTFKRSLDGEHEKKMNDSTNPTTSPTLQIPSDSRSQEESAYPGYHLAYEVKKLMYASFVTLTVTLSRCSLSLSLSLSFSLSLLHYTFGCITYTCSCREICFAQLHANCLRFSMHLSIISPLPRLRMIAFSLARIRLTVSLYRKLLSRPKASFSLSQSVRFRLVFLLVVLCFTLFSL